MYALLTGTFEVIANLLFLIAITNLELSKLGGVYGLCRCRFCINCHKTYEAKPFIANWLGIATTSSVLAINALNEGGGEQI